MLHVDVTTQNKTMSYLIPPATETLQLDGDIFHLLSNQIYMSKHQDSEGITLQSNLFFQRKLKTRTMGFQKQHALQESDSIQKKYL